MSYDTDAKYDAVSTVENYLDEIVEQIIDDGEASDDLFNDYGSGDAYHHESHVDKHYDLSDAAAVLDELSEHEETDSGLWEGLEPRRAISAQAAYTYGNAVLSYWRDLIEQINEAVTDAIDEQKGDVSGWSVVACQAYIDDHDIDYDAPEEFDDDAVDEIRELVADEWKPDAEFVTKIITQVCEAF